MRNRKKRSKRSSGKLPPFVPLLWVTLNGLAYKDLTASAAKVLPHFLGKVKFVYNDPQRYSTEFSFSYREAKKLGFAAGTHHRNIRELMAKGFIDPVYKGGLRSFGLSTSQFKLSRRWERYGTPDFHKIEDWKSIFPELKTKAAPKMESYNINTENESTV